MRTTAPNPTSRPVRRRRISAALVTLAAVAGLGTAGMLRADAQANQPVGNDPAPPSLEGQLDPTVFDDGNRSIVLRVQHTPDPQDIHDARMVKARAYVRRGDVGPIEVSTRDHDGTVLDSWRAPAPDEASGEGLRDTQGRYAIPYDKRLAVVEIVDTRSGAGTRYRVDPLVEGFCLANPMDIACDRVDLEAGISLVPGGARTLAVGESVEVVTEVRFANSGDGVAEVIARTGAFFVPDFVTFAPNGPTTFDLGRIDGGFTRTETVTWTLTCNEAGSSRIFPDASIGTTGRPSILELDPTDNRWNTWFDVTCTG